MGICTVWSTPFSPLLVKSISRVTQTSPSQVYQLGQRNPFQDKFISLINTILSWSSSVESTYSSLDQVYQFSQHNCLS